MEDESGPSCPIATFCNIVVCSAGYFVSGGLCWINGGPSNQGGATINPCVELCEISKGPVLLDICT